MDTQGIFGNKSQRARDRGAVKVFLSHKHKDVDAAKKIKDILEVNGSAKVDVFMSEDIAKGDAWQVEIEKELYESDWFLMIFTGIDSDDWSWCHHEAGIFRGMMYPDVKRVVVFYPQNVNLPDPLKNYQAVLCKNDRHDDIYRFFDDFFGKEPYPAFGPINQNLINNDPEGRRYHAHRIIEAVGGLVVKSIVPEDTVILHIPNKNDLLGKNEFPVDARILRGSGGIRLFDLGDSGDFSWPEFQQALDDELRSQLAQSFWPAVHEACAKSIRTRRLAATHAVLRSPRDGRHYMPILSRTEIAGNNSATFHLTFVQVAVGTQAEVRDKSVARIFTALNLAHRFRWEVIDPYRDLLRLQEFVEHHPSGANGAANDPGGLAAIWEAIGLIEVEARNRGVQDQEALPADFGPEACEEVRAMFLLWSEKRRQLEDAVRTRDIAGFSRVLAELDPINIRFVSLAAQRLGELVRAGADVGSS